MKIINTVLFFTVLLLMGFVLSANAVTEGVRVSTPDTCWYQGSFFNIPVNIEWTTWSKYYDYCYASAEYDVPPPADPCATTSYRCNDCGSGDYTMCSFELEISFNPGVIQAVTVTPSALLQSWGWTDPFYEINNNAGWIRIASAGGYCDDITGLTDPSTLIFVGFQVNGSPGSDTRFEMEYFQYNEVSQDYVYYGNSDHSTYDDARSIGEVEICEYESVSGTVTYCSNDLPVCDAKVTMEYLPADPYTPAPGIEDVVSTTTCENNCDYDCRGDYILTEVIDGYDYSLWVWKDDQYDNAITAFDASLILRYVVDMVNFTMCQEIAADVSGDCTVSAYDASLIMQFLVNNFSYFPKNRDQSTNWIFFPPNQTPPYLCPEEAYLIDPLIGSLTGRDFYGVILGDVSGNWNPYMSPKVYAGAEKPILFEVVSDTDNELVLSISLDNDISAYGSEFGICVPEGLQFVDAVSGNQNSDWKVISRVDGKSVLIACAGISPSSNTLAEVTFVKNNSMVDLDAITLSDIMVDESIVPGTVQLKGSGDKLIPSDFYLGDNYPNPFNPATHISFDLPVSADIQLRVFNVIGQKVRTLASGFHDAGHHTVTWNATDDCNMQVASGIYFYQLSTVDKVLSKKMVLMK